MTPKVSNNNSGRKERDETDDTISSSNSSSDTDGGGVIIKPVETFEDLLSICGEAGRWQLKVFLLASFCGFMTAFHNLVYAFIGAVPEYLCHVPQVAGFSQQQVQNYTLPPATAGNGFDTCHRYGVNGVWDTGNFTIPGDIRHGEKIVCSEFDFDNATYKSTIAQEYNLVCDNQYWASTVQAMYMFGILCGSPIFGALSDKLGRKKTLLISSVIFIAAAPLVGLAPNFTLLMAARFILGFASPGMYGTSFVLVIEVMGPDWRGLAGNLFCLPFALGYMGLPAVAYFIRDWRTLQLALSVPAILLLVTWWLLPESPRWLLRKGKIQEAEKIMRQMAAANGRSHALPVNFGELTARVADEEREEIRKITWATRVTGVLSGYTQLLQSRQIRTRTLVIYFSWMSISMVYYGLALNTPNLTTDKYLYTFISGVLEVPSYFMVPPLIKYLGRRIVFSGYLLIGGIALLSSLLFERESAVVVAFALFGKLVIGSAYALVYLYATEVFPTLLRTYGLGTASMIGRVGSVAAPYVNLLKNVNPTYPTWVFGSISLAAGLLSLLLPETRNKRLPETVEDVEQRKK